MYLPKFFHVVVFKAYMHTFPLIPKIILMDKNFWVCVQSLYKQKTIVPELGITKRLRNIFTPSLTIVCNVSYMSTAVAKLSYFIALSFVPTLDFMSNFTVASQRFSAISSMEILNSLLPKPRSEFLRIGSELQTEIKKISMPTFKSNDETRYGKFLCALWFSKDYEKSYVNSNSRFQRYVTLYLKYVTNKPFLISNGKSKHYEDLK